ncbi:MAG: serine hydrolase, partial [Actinobacteria bacterium]|nr:serine hydrolase [Actinomycetota bacterium]
MDDKARGVLDKYGIPNAAAFIVRDQGATVLHTAQGVRNAALSASAASNKVDETDYFNVGSISKPITGLLLACLVKKGVLSWNTSMGEVFPEFKSPDMRELCGLNTNFLDTTARQLMSHTSGIDGSDFFNVDAAESQRDTDPFRLIADQGEADGGNSRDVEWQNLQSVTYQRYLYAALSMKKQKYHFGSAHNTGYYNKAVSGYGSTVTICVAMVERLTGKPFETTMTDLLASTIPMEIKYGNLPHGMKLHSYDATKGSYVPTTQSN